MPNDIKIGIYLAYPPRTAFEGEGLAQYIRQLAAALARRDDVRVVIGCPTWLKQDLRGFLTEHAAASRVEFLSLRRRMLAVVVATRLQQLGRRIRMRRPRRPSRIRMRLQALLNRALISAGTATDPFAQTLFIGLGTILAPLVVIALSVLWLPVRIGRGIARRAKGSWLGAKIQSSPTPQTEKQRFASMRSLLDRIFDAVDVDFSDLVRDVLMVERTRLVDAINDRNDVSAWLVPTGFWPEAGGLTAPYVLCLPDMVPREVPVKFAELDPSRSKIVDEIDEVVAKAENFVTFSHAVAQSFIIERHLKDIDKIAVIPHGVNVLDRHIRLMGQALGTYSVDKFASQLIAGYRNTSLQGSEYLRSFDFDSVKFMFFAAQPRPNKNFMTLIKAYEKALRERYIYQKLIVTADLTSLPDVWKYVKDNRLEYDVIMMPRVSEPLLAALYYKATLAICPSLSEGGFPFTFGEAMSVGTPALLARSAVVAETLMAEPELMAAMTFDPFDVDELAEKMVWAASHRADLTALEQPLYDRLAKRDWDAVAGEYMTLFKRVAAAGKPCTSARSRHEWRVAAQAGGAAAKT
jgi:glycosyltransferase involved in cell wall biosynthesis